jgi:hypothetical protein
MGLFGKINYCFLAGGLEPATLDKFLLLFRPFLVREEKTEFFGMSGVFGAAHPKNRRFLEPAIY